MTFKLNPSDQFPAGTNVGAYLATQLAPSSAIPAGAALETVAVAADGSLSFITLVPGEYIAYAATFGFRRFNVPTPGRHLGRGAPVESQDVILDASNSAAQVVADSADAAVLYDTEGYDADASHSITTNTGRFTCVTPGTYIIRGYGQFAANATGVRRLRLRLNGATVLGGSTHGNAGAGLVVDVTVATEVQLAAGDYIEVLAYQSSGGNLNLTAQTLRARRVGT